MSSRPWLCAGRALVAPEPWSVGGCVGDEEVTRPDSSGLPGALVISLDFELHWGVRDHLTAEGSYYPNLVGARTVVPRLLELFREYRIAATWATVGLLFARTRQEQLALTPAVFPRYADPRLSPYQELVGEDEEADPVHFAPSLIRQVAGTPRQEIGTHTYSHYFCLEPGPEVAAFEADLDSAVRAARGLGLVLESMVFPRNQHAPIFVERLQSHGITSFRGRQAGWMHDGVSARRNSPLHRIGRFVDQHVRVSEDLVIPWPAVRQVRGVYNVPASSFLRPVGATPGWLDGVRQRRLVEALQRAARQHGLFHLWWHPHNFGRHPDQNLAFLQELLETFARLQVSEGMVSLSMRDVVAHVRCAGL